MTNSFPYKKLGNRINAALGGRTQQWLANQMGYRRNTVTEWIQGKKSPPPRAIAHLASILSLDPKDLANMGNFSERKVEDVLECYMIFQIQDLQNALPLIKKSLPLIDVAREHGDPSSSLSYLQIVIPQLLTAIDLPRGKEKTDILTLLTKALNTRIAITLETFPRRSIVDRIQEDYDYVRELTKEINDNHEGMMADAWLSDAHYIQNDFEKAIQLGEKVRATSADPMHLVTVYRALQLSYAHRKKRDNFKEVKAEVSNLIEAGKFDQTADRATLREAMIRGEIELRSPKDMNEDERKQIEKDLGLAEQDAHDKPVRMMQVLRSRLVYLSRNKLIDRDQAIEIARRGLDIARGKYARHELEIRNLVATLGISNQVE